MLLLSFLSQYKKHNEQPAGVFYAEASKNVLISGQGKIFGQGMEFMYKDSAKVIRGKVNNYIRRKFYFRKVESGPVASGAAGSFT